jgi:hypothetical protein
MSENQIEMPKYKCHKVVHALKIESMRHGHSKEGERKFNSCVFYPEDKAYEPIEVKGDWCHDKVKLDDEADCGYIVIYADGYSSWSPTKAFEDGYTRL